MTFTVRVFDRDFAGITPLVNLLNADPTTPEQVEEAHARFPADGLRHRMVAVGQAGEVLGYLNVSGRPTVWPGEFYCTLIVEPGARGRGIGSALLASAEQWAREKGGKLLRTGVSDIDDPSVRFARNQGFTEEGHQFESVLDLPGFDLNRFAGVVEQVKAGGIRFFTYADQPGEETQHDVYELYKVTDLDTPGYAGLDPAKYPPFSEWHAGIFGNEKTLHDGVIIAADGDRFVGLVVLQREEGGGLYNEYAGVLREYRGRQIGLALKLLSVEVARRRGAPYMRTKNNAKNAPMLSINEKMGYRRVPGRYWFIKAI